MMITWNWKENNSMLTCDFCGQPNARGRNSMTVGMCPLHLKIWEEDIEYGLHKRNRLRDIMIERGQIDLSQTSPNQETG